MRHQDTHAPERPRPRYVQIMEDLERRIATELAPGDSLPSEAELAATYGVSRLTVRDSVAALVRRGLVVTRKGSGSFVADPVSRYPIAAGREASLTRAMRARGHDVTSQLIAVGDDDDPRVLARLRQPGPAVRFETVRRVDDAPWSLTRTWICEAAFPGIAREWDGRTSLYETLLERYGVRTVRADRAFAAVPADAAVNEWLLVPLAMPVLRVTGLNVVDRTGRPAVLVEHQFPGDRVEFVTEFA